MPNTISDKLIIDFIFCYKNDKFRVISMDSKTFTEKIVPSPAAVRLLEVAGYRERDDGN